MFCVFVAYDTVCPIGYDGASHDLDARTNFVGERLLRRASWSLAGDGETIDLFAVCEADGIAIHHGAIKGWEGAVGCDCLAKHAPSALF